MPIQFTFAILAVMAYAAFKIEKRGNPPFSTVSWLVLIWAILNSIRPIYTFLYPNRIMAFRQSIDWGQGTVEIFQANALERNLKLALIVLGLAALYRKRGRFVAHFRENKWIYIFYAYSFISIIWSAYPGIAIKRWIRLAGDAVFALLILTDGNPERSLERIIRRIAVILLPLSVVFVKYYDRLGRIYTIRGEQMWVGVTGHKNSLGVLCAYIGLVLVWRCLKNWPRIDPMDVLLLGMDFYLLIGSKSSTSIIVTTIGIAILIIQRKVKGNQKDFNRILLATLAAILVIQIMAIAFLNSSLAPLFFSATGKDISLTGRVPLWQELLKKSQLSPVWGYGFDSFWMNTDQVRAIWESVGWTPTNGHNGYLDNLLNLGLIGTLILLLMIKQAFKNISSRFDENRYLGMIKTVFFTIIILHNFTETSWGMPNTILWWLWLFSSVIAYENTPAPLEKDVSISPLVRSA